MPKISVITPAYNRADMLKETIESVLAQTYEDFEYIIVDDGSTDATKELVKRYLDDSRVENFYHENIGEPKTVNRGYSLSKGEYTIVVNSDDPLYDKDYFKKAVETFETETDILAVYPNWVEIDENSNELSKVKDKQFDFLGLSVTGGLMIGPGMIIKHSALEAIGFRDESVKYTGDLSITFQIARLGRIKHLEIFGATHRRHKGCLQNTAPQEDIAKELLELYLKVFRDDKRNIPPEILRHRKKILKTALYMYCAYAKNPLKYSDLFCYKALFNDVFDKIYFYFSMKKRGYAA